MENSFETDFPDIHSDLPSPWMFNCWKHHRDFILRQIDKYIAEDGSVIENITPKLLLIGNSQLDIYLGKLTEVQIVQQIEEKLKIIQAFFKPDYINWINSKDKSYRLINLSDRSIWTLRIGQKAGRYIHLHPGRYSHYSLRVRANTLKTAILSIILAKMNNFTPFNLELINQVRVQNLHLAPVKSIEKATGLKELMVLLTIS
jgi:hypothetical protein